MRIESSQILLQSNNSHYKEKSVKEHSFIKELGHTTGGFTALTENSLTEEIKLEKEVFIKSAEKINQIVETKELKREEKFQSKAEKTWNDFGTTGYFNQKIEQCYEEQSLEFTSKGIIKTADNREIEFNVNFNFSKEFESYNLKESVFTDPLVINLDNPSAQINNKDFYFDIDADGTLEQIPQLKEGSGFLAFDRNSDGQINDGTELFGAKTGDGFSELGAYDDDNNGWIDENDAIFNHLKIFSIDDKGDKKLTGIVEAGVGAIYLGSESTEYSLTTAQNGDLANVKRSGFFLKENGDVGVIQEIDIAEKQSKFNNLSDPFFQGFGLNEITFDNLDLEGFPIAEEPKVISILDYFMNRYLLLSEEEKEEEKRRAYMNNTDYDEEKKYKKVTL